MNDLKTFIIEKIFLVGSILFVAPYSNITPDSVNARKDTVVQPLNYLKIDAPKNKPLDSLSPKDIIEDAKQTVESYNESVKRKEEVQRKSLELTKKEIKNTKDITNLVSAIIQKYKDKTKEEAGYSSLKKDSVCSRSTKYLLKKDRVCNQYTIRYYVTKGKDTIVLGTIKNNIR